MGVVIGWFFFYFMFMLIEAFSEHVYRMGEKIKKFFVDRKKMIEIENENIKFWRDKQEYIDLLKKWGKNADL